MHDPFTRRTVLGMAGSAIAVPVAIARTLPDGLVFFVGNSFTRQHDIPGLVCRIARHAGVPAHCHRQTADGARLVQSIDVPANLAATHGQGPDRRIPARVVLQDHSIVPLTPDARAASARAMSAYHAAFSGTVLFETWPRQAGHYLYKRPGMPRDPAGMAALTRQHYRAQADAMGAGLAPVGTAWMAATARGINLYARDGYHANPAGAWLCAMVLADALGFPGAFAVDPPPTIPAGVNRTLTRIAQQGR